MHTETTRHMIAAHKLPALQAAAEKLQKHAKRLGRPADVEIKLDGEGTTTVEVLTGHGQDSRFAKVEVAVVYVLVTCPRQVEGERLVAVVEALGDERVVGAVPGEAAEGELVPFRSGPLACSHCRTARRRKRVYVVRGAGGLRAVGSDCLPFVLGSDRACDMGYLADVLPLLRLVGSGLEPGDAFGESQHLPLRTYLAFVAAEIAANGFRSRKACEFGGLSTADAALSALCKAKLDRDADALAMALTRHGVAVDAAIAYYADLEATSDFDMNLRAIARATVVPGRSTGLAACVYAMHARELDKRAERAAARPSEYVGEVGKRLRWLRLSVVSTKDVGGQFASVLHVFRDEAGNMLKWFSSGKTLEQGKAVIVDATVKAHEEYKGAKQTLITRVTELAAEAVAA